ncbi:DNA polymerase III subunit beta [Rhizobium leguminosarum]|uniref:DNA polymerase III subunit beta n=1 Tax=Rhizobium leguminosarum TaxID=384 RepID=UPI000FEC456E|nr:DNA polymerase III subunit beta [Rhizobium leguminosarum]RWX40809.1 DNA polymerase III subunit beta [Rhizobium leguminosarum]
MRFSIARQDLARVLTNVGRVIEARNTIPILGNVLLAADANGLRVTGTDLDIVATDVAAATVEQPGTVCVDAKLLADISKKAGGDVSVSLEADKLVVKSGRSLFKLATLPAADFPSLDGGKFSASFDIDLAALFAPVAFAMSTEETRYYLNGVFLHLYEDGDQCLRAVATDGHRLSRHQVAYPGEDAFTGIIVPRKTVGVVPKGLVNVAVSESKIRITSGDFILTSKLIDGAFPDYERIMPRNNDNVVTVDRDAFMKAADRVATVSSERGRAVKLSIAPGAVGFTVNNADAVATDEVEAAYTGEPIEIGFNAAYLRDLFGVLPSGPVTLALADAGSPGLFTSAGFEGLTLVGMPMRV